jgi:hypothetical protein
MYHLLLTVRNTAFCPHCVYVFCMIFTSNNDILPKYRQSVGLRSVPVCFLCGMDWTFIWPVDLWVLCSGTCRLHLFYCTVLVISRRLSETSRGYLPLDLRVKIHATLGVSIPNHISLCIIKSIQTLLRWLHFREQSSVTARTEKAVDKKALRRFLRFFRALLHNVWNICHPFMGFYVPPGGKHPLVQKCCPWLRLWESDENTRRVFASHGTRIRISCRRLACLRCFCEFRHQAMTGDPSMGRTGSCELALEGPRARVHSKAVCSRAPSVGRFANDRTPCVTLVTKGSACRMQRPITFSVALKRWLSPPGGCDARLNAAISVSQNYRKLQL